jgi:lysophospholipase L1-like esterase
MRIRFVTLFVLLMMLGAVSVCVAAGPTYYLALGDSLAVGIQWSASGDVPTNEGYVDDLYAQFSQRIPGLALAPKLGCSGETTSSMIHGGICSNYPVGSSQLDAAIAFLQTHKVAFVTLDIGANDIDHCFSSTAIDTSCVEAGLNSVASNLPWILRELRSAAGPQTPIVAMNYYDPFLAAWALGGNGPSLALESLEAATEFNLLLEAIYGVFGVPVADVARAFRIYNFTPVPEEDLPVNVFLTLSWTWMTAPPPFGPDVHPNTAGYAAIAGAFATKITLP